MSGAEEIKPKPTVGEILDKAAKSAIRGGTAGAVAMGLNVGALMWMRTTVRFFYVFQSRQLLVRELHPMLKLMCS